MRLAQIDGLRGIAALSVMAFHLTSKYAEFFQRDSFPIHLPLGSYGVQLFFAISGFVILMTLTNIKSPMDFLVSRFSRLYPAYWVSVLITAGLLASFPVSLFPVTPEKLAGNLLMFHGIFNIPHVDGVYWSLQEELIFYALMLLLWTCGALKRPLIAVGLWLVCAIASELFYIPWTVVSLTSLQWIPWFALGITAYVLHSKGPDHRYWPAILALSAIAIYLKSGAGVAAFATVVFTLVFMAARGSLKFLASRAFVFLGAISYPLYLVHQNISYSMMLRADDAGISPIVYTIAAAGISLGLAYAIHRAVEIPAMKAIRKRYASREKHSPMRWAAGISATMMLLAIGMFVSNHA